MIASKPPINEPDFTEEEELANSVTHGVGFVLSVVGAPVLVAFSVLRGDVSHIASCSIFGLTLVLMYATSTLYHSFKVPRIKRILRVLDHIAIYLLIAGTYTPFLLVYFGDGFGWTLLGVVWGIALAGSVFKVFFTGRFIRLSTALYLAMGWLAVFAAEPLMTAMPIGGIGWLVAGGLFYTFGVIFFAWKSLPYNHAIWHLFVLAGSLCHYAAVVLHVLP